MRSSRGRKAIINYNKVNRSQISPLKVEKPIHFAILTVHIIIWLLSFDYLHLALAIC